jgi:hypothetical protein
MPGRDPSEDRIRFLEDDARCTERGIAPHALDEREVGAAVRDGRDALEQQR